MENIQVAENADNELIIHDKMTSRYFKFDCPKKFNVYGFGSLDTKTTLYPRVFNKDFSYYLTQTHLIINVELINGTRRSIFQFECEEIYPHSWIELNTNQLDPNVILYIQSLKNKIVNLETKIDDLEEQINELKENKSGYESY